MGFIKSFLFSLQEVITTLFMALCVVIALFLQAFTYLFFRFDILSWTLNWIGETFLKDDEDKDEGC